MKRDEMKPEVKSIKKSLKYRNRFHKHGAKSTHVYPFVWDYLSESKGPFCKDIDGNTFLDLAQHAASTPLGYNHPEIEEALKEYKIIDPIKMAGQDFYVKNKVPGPTELQEKIVETTEKFNLDTVFLLNSGAEAVENAIKISYDRKGKKGVSFDKSFHGRTLGALTLTQRVGKYKKRYPKIPGVEKAPFCTCRDKYNGKCKCGAIEKAKKKIEETEELSYVIIEPIQGEGGYRIPSKEFMKRIKDKTKDKNALFISDEIQAGLGRTGKFWAIEHYEVEPDVITSAKGLRVGATISNRDNFPEEKGRISTTWGAGDILASFIGYKTIEIIQKNNLVENAEERGKYLLKKLREMELEEVSNIRGKGLMAAIDLETKEKRNKVVQESFKNGLMLLGCGEKSIRFLPPLDIREREIDIAVNTLKDII